MKSLIIAYNPGVASHQSIVFLKSVVPFLWNNRAMTTLNLSFCNLGDSFMSYLSDGLCHNLWLNVLDLKGNRVTCDGVSGIC